MIYFKCKALSCLNCTYRKSAIPDLSSSLQLCPLVFTPRFCATVANNQHPFTVSYLVNTCGFSLEEAISVSKRVQIRTPENPDRVIKLFKRFGFSDHHLLGIIKTEPNLLLFNPEKIILPKFEFFCSKGVSSPELVQIICKKPRLLRRSLEKNIVPGYKLISSLMHSDEMVIPSLKGFPYLFADDFHLRVWPNITILRGIGVPGPKIVRLLDNCPMTFYVDPLRLEKFADEVKKLGFHPSKFNFLQALSTMVVLGKSKWQRKFEIYKKWGWSEEEFYAAFRLYPWIMSTSAEKIIAIIQLFDGHLGVEPSALVRKPVIFGMSLEKRLVPRVSVIKLLVSKGLLTKEPSWLSLLLLPDKVFLEKIITSYKEEAPHLLKLYNKKFDLSDDKVASIMESDRESKM